MGYRERPDPFDAPGEDSDEWKGIQSVGNRLDTSITITGLLNGQAYLVSVRTLVDGGMSEWSALVLGIPVIPASGPIFIGGGGGDGGGTSPPPSPPRPQPRTPEITISAGTSPVTEGTAATFTITANPAPATALTVNVDVSETGDVISGTPSSTVTIDANKTTATLTVNTVNDEGDESNSVVTAEVETGTGYTVGSTSSASVTVNDNDTPSPPPPPSTPGITPVCDRTPQVRDEIVEEAPVSTCSDVTEAHLSAITYLRFYEKGISALQAGDFSGLTALETLDLGNNELSSLVRAFFLVCPHLKYST